MWHNVCFLTHLIRKVLLIGSVINQVLNWKNRKPICSLIDTVCIEMIIKIKSVQSAGQSESLLIMYNDVGDVSENRNFWFCSSTNKHANLIFCSIVFHPISG
ncbi:hypothetical protein CHARACLAT_033056 [Characodon lateralis]|uniref:Secreted protein n=1 Tax=Characodon lateralis TaxID=208331 RepID=A0ABU7DLT8_9TELE|nr:hypothetical protein [Characodon lateralis]